MQKYFLLIIAVLFISCKQSKQESKLKLCNFILANYRWILNKPPDTSYSFILSKYVSIRQNGVAEIINTDNEKIEYFKDTLPDTLINKINKLLLNKRFKKYYPYEDDNSIINDGGQYYISYIDVDSIRHETIFEPYRKPNTLDSVRELIENFLDNKILHETKPFGTDSITNYLKYYSRKIYPLPQIHFDNPPKIEMKKFIVPKVTK